MKIKEWKSVKKKSKLSSIIHCIEFKTCRTQWLIFRSDQFYFFFFYSHTSHNFFCRLFAKFLVFYFNSLLNWSNSGIERARYSQQPNNVLWKLKLLKSIKRKKFGLLAFGDKSKEFLNESKILKLKLLIHHFLS